MMDAFWFWLMRGVGEFFGALLGLVVVAAVVALLAAVTVLVIVVKEEIRDHFKKDTES